jgi:hypothetical protein
MPARTQVWGSVRDRSDVAYCSIVLVFVLDPKPSPVGTVGFAEEGERSRTSDWLVHAPVENENDENDCRYTALNRYYISLETFAAE